MFFSLLKTSNCFPTFLVILATCLLKFSELSIVTPKRSTIGICTLFILTKRSPGEIFGRIIHLHFSGLSISLLSLNQRLATARSPLITDFTTSGSRSLKKIEHLTSLYHRDIFKHTNCKELCRQLTVKNLILCILKC